MQACVHQYSLLAAVRIAVVVHSTREASALPACDQTTANFIAFPVCEVKRWGTRQLSAALRRGRCTVDAGHHPAKLRVHASSVLHRTAAPWLLFNAVSRGVEGWLDMREVSTIEPAWLHEVAPTMYLDPG